MKYREDECPPETWDWRDDARATAQDAAADMGRRRRLTPAEVRAMTPDYPWSRPLPPKAPTNDAR